MMYVTLERAKDHLNMDHDEDDNLITTYVQAASSAVKNYLKSGMSINLNLYSSLMKHIYCLRMPQRLY